MHASRGTLPGELRILGFAVVIGIPLCWASAFYVRWAPALAAVAFPFGFVLYALGVVWLLLVVGHLLVGYRLLLADGICLAITLAYAIVLALQTA